MVRGGQDHGDNIRFVGFQSPGVGVYLIAQLLGSLLHLDAVFLPHRQAIEHPAHRAQSHTGFPGDILHGWISFFHGTNLLYYKNETFLNIRVSNAFISLSSFYQILFQM